VYGGFAGVETSRPQRDWTLHPVVLSGDLNGDDGPGFINYADNARHVVTATLMPDAATATLDGFVIAGGSADANGPNNGGGGLACAFGSAVFRHIIFQANRTSSRGGGAWSS